ncbi:Xaa-Pro peptidase family protein [Nitratireductor sp. StC3]|uniref:M24 family metallopeptidase n=1 Tax=Nitratireductor sp. StC3 TaxID=2126741 RepID=UPI000D0CCD65|nr:Xaa-Pro peptidase family protein [Nitratireductor sp. StC3]PSM16249.1 hypothetical protein C7T96_21500 [Nitratireductor sp. StC3]
MTNSSDRIGALRGLMAEAGLDAAAFIPGATFRYLTGGVFHVMERPTVLIVPRQGRPVVVLPDMEADSWTLLSCDAHVIRWRDEEGYAAAFAKAAELVEARRLGVEGLSMRVVEANALRAAFPGAELIDMQAWTLGLRAVKDDAEIACLRKAVAMAEAALTATLDEVDVGMSEQDVQRLMLQNILAQPVQGPVSPPLVLAGPSSAMPHGRAGSYRLKVGDALLFDFGVGAGGYRSDITRTVFIGDVSPEDRALYECVLAANTLGREIARPGLTAHALDDAVRGHLEASPYADYVVHKTGHGLGLDVHEAPQIIRGNHVELVAGNVITIEPGLYRPGRLGVRIEDDVLVTADGCESLSALPRELLVVG